MSLRPLSSEMEQALKAKLLRVCLFFEAEVADGFIRLWTGSYPIFWNEKTWTGAGLLLGFSGTMESLVPQANGWAVTLSGLNSEIAALALEYIIQGKLGHVWLGALSSNGVLLSDPVKIASGRIDVPSITDGELSTISLSFESVFIDLKALREFRWTDESHKVLYPNDPSFEFITAIQKADFSWGRK